MRGSPESGTLIRGALGGKGRRFISLLWTTNVRVDAVIRSGRDEGFVCIPCMADHVRGDNNAIEVAKLAVRWKRLEHIERWAGELTVPQRVRQRAGADAVWFLSGF